MPIYKIKKALLELYTGLLSKKWSGMGDTPADISQASVLFSRENAKFKPDLAHFDQFWLFGVNLCTFWCTFYKPNQCGGVPNRRDIRHGCLR